MLHERLWLQKQILLCGKARSWKKHKNEKAINFFLSYYLPLVFLRRNFYCCTLFFFSVSRPLNIRVELCLFLSSAINFHIVSPTCAEWKAFQCIRSDLNEVFIEIHNRPTQMWQSSTIIGPENRIAASSSCIYISVFSRRISYQFWINTFRFFIRYAWTFEKYSPKIIPQAQSASFQLNILFCLWWQCSLFRLYILFFTYFFFKSCSKKPKCTWTSNGNGTIKATVIRMPFIGEW